MDIGAEQQPTTPRPGTKANPRPGGVYGGARDFLENDFIYAVISPRARGLSIGVNCCPDKKCNFDCVYCEVDRRQPGKHSAVDLDVLSEELHRMLNFVHAGGMALHPRFAGLLPGLLKLQHVTLSGDGEPTMSPQFLEIAQTVMHVRALGRVPFFKIVLVTNGTCLDAPQVEEALKLFTKDDEVWAKLDGGTSTYLQTINAPTVPLDKVISNILLIARKRPVVIQTLFPMMREDTPPESELGAYADRLNALKGAGAKIKEVQIYSATRPQTRNECGHLPLRHISRIAAGVRAATGLTVNIY